MKNIERILMGCLMLLLAACQQQEGVENVDGVAELTFKLVLPSNGSRGNVTEYPSDTETWTEAEKLVNGRYLYIVSVYLVDSNNTIVARREVQVDNQATELTFSFDKSDQLKQGAYKLMAVANYTDYTIEGVTYKSGLTEAWKSNSYQDLLSNQISLNADNISPKNVIQPLSMMKDIELYVGNNMVTGELVRTFTRVRIEVMNNSGTEDLKVYDLIFSSNFSQKTAPVFENAAFQTETVAPVATSELALQPFTRDNGQDFKTIAPLQSAVVFDGYLLESKIASDAFYEYVLDLSYGVSGDKLRAGKQLNKLSDIANTNLASSYFLIQNVRSQLAMNSYTDDGVDYRMNQDQANSLEYLKTQLDQPVGRNCLWRLEAARPANCYYLQHVESGRYAGEPHSSSESVVLNANKQNYYIFTESGNGIQMQYNGGLYLNDFYQWIICGWGVNNDAGNPFVFYRVTKELASQDPIQLTTIDPVTQQPSYAKAIKRNDFINVLVTVAYNNIAGKFEFNVKDWSTGGGNVEFN